MFIGPWDQGGPWNPTGIEGIHRFLGRVWHIAQAEPTRRRTGREVLGGSGAGARAARATHTTIAAVTEEYGAFRFNTAIAKLMELSNAIHHARGAGIGGSAAYGEAVDALLLLLAPGAPHIAEELWQRRGHAYSVHQQPWPAFDPRWRWPTPSSCRCRWMASCATGWWSRATRRPRRSSGWRWRPSTSSATWTAAHRGA